MAATGLARRKRVLRLRGLVALIPCIALEQGLRALACTWPYTGKVILHLAAAEVGTHRVYLVPKSTLSFETTHQALIKDGQPLVFNCLSSGTYTLVAGQLKVDLVVGPPQA